MPDDTPPAVLLPPRHLWTIENDQLRLHFHPGQTRTWNSRRRFVFMLAGSQGGKTSFGPWWLWREIMRCGKGDYLAVTSSYDLFKLKLLPVMRETFENLLKIGRYWSSDRIIELRNPVTGKFEASRVDDPMWGRIILRSAESGGGLESATAKAALFDECGQDSVTLETWEAIQRRLSLSQGRVLGTTTIYNLGWLKREVYDSFTRGDKTFDVISFSSVENPSFPQSEFERMEGRMTKAKFDMFYRGLFTRPLGMIYSDFDEATQVVDPFVIPFNNYRIVGLDFGPVNTAMVWLAIDPFTRRVYLYRESLKGDLTTAEHVRQAKEISRTENIVGTWGGAGSEDQYRRDWGASGWEVQKPPIGDVESGIDKVVELIKTKRLYIFRTCRGILDEIGSYRRKVDENGEVTNEIEEKRKYHRLDALRYAAVGLTSTVESGSFTMSYTN